MQARYRLLKRYGDRTIADATITGTRARREIARPGGDHDLGYGTRNAEFDRELAAGAILLRGTTAGFHVVLLAK